MSIPLGRPKLSSVPTRGPPDPPCFSGRHVPRRLRHDRSCVALASDGVLPDTAQRSKPRVLVEELQTYDEVQQRLSKRRDAMNESRNNDEEGGLDGLIPGARPQDRPSAAGAATANQMRAQSRPLKINQDLRLYRAREARINAQRLADGDSKRALQRRSEEGFRQAIARDPTDARAYVSLGTLYARTGRCDEARRIFEQGCSVTEGNNAYIWTALANLERKLNNYNDARKYYDAALVVNTKHAAAWHGWGMLEKHAGNFRRARDVLMRGIDKCQGQSISYLYDAIGNLAADLDLIEEARQWFRLGTNSIQGTNSHALYTSWACLEWKKGDIKVAPYLFDMALRAHPKNRFALLSYAMMEKDLGNVDRCRQLLERALALNPTDPALFQAYGVLLSEEGDLEGARRKFSEGLGVARDHQPLWHAWASMEAAAGNSVRARELFQKGVWVNPKSRSVVYLWQSWGVMEGRLGNLTQARSLFKAGIKADAMNGAIWQAWIEMEEANDLLESAQMLRNYRMETFNRVALPPNFSTLSKSDGPIVQLVQKWFNLLEPNKKRPAEQAAEESALFELSQIAEPESKVSPAADKTAAGSSGVVSDRETDGTSNGVEAAKVVSTSARADKD